MARQIKLVLLVALAALFLTGQSGTVTTTADISGTSAAVQVAASGGARWVQFIAPSSNSQTERWGDSSVSATRGGLLPPGSGQLLPVESSAGDTTPQRYNLASLYVYVVNGDKLTVVWGN